VTVTSLLELLFQQLFCAVPIIHRHSCCTREDRCVLVDREIIKNHKKEHVPSLPLGQPGSSRPASKLLISFHCIKSTHRPASKLQSHLKITHLFPLHQKCPSSCIKITVVPSQKYPSFHCIKSTHRSASKLQSLHLKITHLFPLHQKYPSSCIKITVVPS